jgi:hypothetical protein
MNQRSVISLISRRCGSGRLLAIRLANSVPHARLAGTRRFLLQTDANQFADAFIGDAELPSSRPRRSRGGYEPPRLMPLHLLLLLTLLLLLAASMINVTLTIRALPTTLLPTYSSHLLLHLPSPQAAMHSHLCLL